MSEEVVRHLNRYLHVELTGHEQYLIASAQLSRWGYHGLSYRQAEYSAEETSHARRILLRILFLGATPTTRSDTKAVVGQTVRAQFEDDRKLVAGAIELLGETLQAASLANDGGTHALVEEMLIDEESHLHWLDQQLCLMDRLGEAHYLRAQMGGPIAEADSSTVQESGSQRGAQGRHGKRRHVRNDVRHQLPFAPTFRKR